MVDAFKILPALSAATAPIAAVVADTLSEGRTIAATPGPERKGADRKIIAIIDDHSGIGQGLVEGIPTALPGSTATWFASCEQALADPNLTRFQVFLVDYNLGPGSMPGPACVRVLRPRVPNALILGYTAEDISRVTARYVEAGADGAIGKMQSFQELVNQILTFP